MIQVIIADVPDRENLVAELWVGDEQMAEVNLEDKEARVALYSRKSGEPWDLEFTDILRALQLAKERLQF